jgi:hypothetical protein
MAEWQPPNFPTDAEIFVSTLAQIAAIQGDATTVAVLAESSPLIEFDDSRRDWGKEWNYFRLRLDVDPGLYGRLSVVPQGATCG